MSVNTKLIAWLDNSFYPTFRSNWDNDQFRELVLPHLDSQNTVLLDIGAGRGALPHMNFKDKVKKAVGIDPGQEISGNPYLHAFEIGFGDDMPCFTNNSFDVVVSNNVLEHINDAQRFFNEVSRVTKPGGVVITKTPNLTHYMPLIARLTPHSFHLWVNKMRGRPEVDTFPTQYKANTRAVQKQLAEKAGLTIERFLLVEGRPEYLRFSVPTYLVGILYEKLVNGLGLDSLKIVLFTVMRKPG
jgi:ubiquinone/menaquinone biosynthesis C-methylase UbiE